MSRRFVGYSGGSIECLQLMLSSLPPLSKPSSWSCLKWSQLAWSFPTKPRRHFRNSTCSTHNNVFLGGEVYFSVVNLSVVENFLYMLYSMTCDPLISDPNLTARFLPENLYQQNFQTHDRRGSWFIKHTPREWFIRTIDVDGNQRVARNAHLARTSCLMSTRGHLQRTHVCPFDARIVSRRVVSSFCSIAEFKWRYWKGGKIEKVEKYDV